MLSKPKPTDDSASSSASETGDDEAESVHSPSPKHNGTVEDDCETEEVEVLVSSRHLALASRVFRVMFDGNFLEKITPGQSGLKRVPLPEDDYEALMVILRILHGQNGSVPQELERREFVDIAMLVDKYELVDACRMHGDRWMKLRPSIEVVSWPALADWLYTTWVFRRDVDFKKLT